MTCIVALVEGDSVWVGGDTAGTHEESWLQQTGLESKVWKQGEVVIGGCGSFRIMQLLRHRMTMPAVPDDGDVMEFLVGDFVDSMRQALMEGGALSIWEEDQTESMDDSGYILAVRGRIFEVYSDFGVGEFEDGFVSIGCGKAFALGSLYSSGGTRPRRRVKLALEAAEHFSAGVRGPMTIVKMT